ncbi:MAG: DUF86 domain-containing protein [Candidatus Hodarchaeota archaeon]
MSKKRNIMLFFTDMIEAIDNIMTYTLNMDYDEFMKDRKTKDAVVRNLEVIGEAVKNLPKETRKKYSEVNWKAVSGMRDKLIHEYFGVSYQIVWETIKTDLPLFASQIKIIMQNEGLE